MESAARSVASRAGALFLPLQECKRWAITMYVPWRAALSCGKIRQARASERVTNQTSKNRVNVMTNQASKNRANGMTNQAYEKGKRYAVCCKKFCGAFNRSLHLKMESAARSVASRAGALFLPLQKCKRWAITMYVPWRAAFSCGKIRQARSSKQMANHAYESGRKALFYGGFSNNLTTRIKQGLQCGYFVSIICCQRVTLTKK